MKKCFLLIITVLFALGVKAQNAEQTFKSAVDKLKTYDNIEIAFDYIMINNEADIYETMDGAGFLQGDAYKLLVMDQVIICDGTTTWTYNADAQEVMISEVDKTENNTPLSIIDSYYDDITAKFLNGNSDEKKIEIKSLKGDDNFVKLIVNIDDKSLNIKEIHLFDNDNTEFVYVIKRFVTNQTLPADFFTFKESDFPDAEIIDMR